MKGKTTLNKYKLHLSAQCWCKISSSCNWRTVSKRYKLATRIALYCVGRRRQVSGQVSGQASGPRSGRCSKFFISRYPCIFARCAAVNINVLLTVYKHIDGNILPPLTDSGHN